MVFITRAAHRLCQSGDPWSRPGRGSVENSYEPYYVIMRLEGMGGRIRPDDALHPRPKEQHGGLDGRP